MRIGYWNPTRSSADNRLLAPDTTSSKSSTQIKTQQVRVLTRRRTINEYWWTRYTHKTQQTKYHYQRSQAYFPVSGPADNNILTMTDCGRDGRLIHVIPQVVFNNHSPAGWSGKVLANKLVIARWLCVRWWYMVIPRRLLLLYIYHRALARLEVGEIYIDMSVMCVEVVEWEWEGMWYSCWW